MNKPPAPPLRPHDLGFIGTYLRGPAIRNYSGNIFTNCKTDNLLDAVDQLVERK